MNRWLATIHYRHDEGTRTVIFPMEELSELADKVEAGPHWDCIVSIKTVRVNAAYPKMTVEEAMAL